MTFNISVEANSEWPWHALVLDRAFKLIRFSVGLVCYKNIKSVLTILVYSFQDFSNFSICHFSSTFSECFFKF